MGEFEGARYEVHCNTSIERKPHVTSILLSFETCFALDLRFEQGSCG
jgi:hypothetical protein